MPRIVGFADRPLSAGWQFGRLLGATGEGLLDPSVPFSPGHRVDDDREPAADGVDVVEMVGVGGECASVPTNDTKGGQPPCTRSEASQSDRTKERLHMRSDVSNGIRDRGV